VLTGTTGGGLQIGDYRSGSSHTGYFNGAVAEVNAYASALTGPQVAATDTGRHGRWRCRRGAGRRRDRLWRG